MPARNFVLLASFLVRCAAGSIELSKREITSQATRRRRFAARLDPTVSKATMGRVDRSRQTRRTVRALGNRVRARGDAEAAAAAREIERLRAEIEASRSAGAAAATANPIAQAVYQPELPTVAGTVSPIGRVVGVVRGWSSRLVARRPSTASATTPPPTCEVVDVESPAPKAETMKRPPPAGAPPRGLPWGALPPAGAPPRGLPWGAPPPPA